MPQGEEGARSAAVEGMILLISRNPRIPKQRSSERTKGLCGAEPTQTAPLNERGSPRRRSSAMDYTRTLDAEADSRVSRVPGGTTAA